MEKLLAFLRSTTGSGASKRVLSAILGVVGLVLVLIGKQEASQLVTDQPPGIIQGWGTILEALILILSAVLAIWSKVQGDKK